MCVLLDSIHQNEVLKSLEESQETTAILLLFGPHFQFFQKT